MSKILDKISKVLNQAENASTAEEAAAFMEMAQKLASANAIDLALARQRTAKREEREQPMQKRIQLGTSGTRSLKDYVSLFVAIAGSNDLKINIAHNSTYVILFGMPSDIEVAEVLYNSLVVQMVQAAQDYLASGEYKNELVFVRKPIYDVGFDWTGRKVRYLVDYETVQKPVDGRVARRNFYEGFVSRIDKRLRKAASEALADALQIEATNDQTDGPGTTLVLASKKEEVADFYKQKSTARGSYRGRSGGAHSSSSRSAGSAAGERARLSSQGALAGARGAIGA